MSLTPEDELKEAVRCTWSMFLAKAGHRAYTPLEAWIIARLDLLEYRTEKLFRLRQADLGVRRKQEEEIVEINKRINALELRNAQES